MSHRILHILFAVVAVLGVCTPSAIALEARVVGNDGAPVANARVTVIGRAGSVVADSDGRFVIDPEPTLPFVLFVARSDGVALKPVTVVELSGSGTLEVVVEPAGETVTVVGGAVPDLEVPLAVAATVIGRADLSRRQPTSLTEVLETIPGAGRGGEGRSVVPGLRGLPKHRTLILLDGGRVTAERRAGPSATFLDPETLDEVEVIRGPGSVAYGSDAFGGIIRARSRMPQPTAPTEVRYSLVGASNAGEIGGTAEVAFPALGGGMLAGAQARRFDNYSSPRGEVLDSGSDERGFRLAFQRAMLGGMLRVGWRTDEARDVGKPSPDSGETSVTYPEESSNRLHLGFESPGPGRWSRLSVSAAWDSYELALSKDRFATAEEPRQLKLSRTDAQDYELRFEAERPVGVLRMVVGANAYGRFDLHGTNRTSVFGADGGEDVILDEVSVESARRDDIGVFVGLGADLGRWGLSGGVRGDVVKSRNSGGYFGDHDTSNSDLSGFLAASYDLTVHLEVALQAARGFRDALLSDRYYRGETGRGFITGNPALMPETSRQMDLALRYANGRLSWAAYAFHYRISELIERYGDADDYLFRNRAEAELTGVELEGTVALGAAHVLHFGGQYQRGEVVDDGEAMDDVPAFGGFLLLRGDPDPRLWWTLRLAAFARDDRPGPNEQVVPGYAVVDAGIGWRFSDAVQLQLLARNLFDHTYLGSADEDAVLAPGRSLQLTLRGTF